MTRERLEGLPINVLLDLAVKENLSVEADISREDLIDELLDAYEEDRRERETLQSLILKLEQTKFASLPDAAPSAFTQDPVLPGPYDENSISVVLRDPSWAFALWEVKKKELDAWAQDPSFRGLALRVLEYASPEGACLTFFPLSVPLGPGSRYIHLPTPGHWYALELHVQTERESRLLARSPVLHAPAELPDDPQHRPALTKAQARLLEVSGSALCETVPPVTEATPAGYPQRIGGWDDSAFQDVAE